MIKIIIIGLVVLIMTLIKGDIHSNKQYAANAVMGVIAGTMPIILDLIGGLTELFKMLAALAALGVAVISLHRAWKFRNNPK